MMIDNISSSSSGVKSPTGAQQPRKADDAQVNVPAITTIATKQKVASAEAVEAAVKELNEFIKPASASIQFALDEDSGRTIVKMVDTETNEVVRQIPSEEALAISKALDRLQGLTVRMKA
jgi:flagellar protein FlaG